MTNAQQTGKIPVFTQGDRLRKAREAAGYDQRPFAELLGVSPKTITSAEKGHHGVRRIVLNAWSLATGVPLYWLEHGTETEPDGPIGAVPPAGFEPATSALRGRINSSWFAGSIAA